MKKFIYSFVATAYLFSFSAIAATNATTPAVTATNGAAGAQIGVLDMRQVMERSTQIAQIRDKLQKEFKPKQEKMLTLQSTLKADAERLRRDNAIMSNNDRKQLEQKIITEQQDLQKMQSNFQQELVAAQNKELKGFLDNVKTIVDKVAKNDNLYLIITKDTVAYMRPNIDVTNKVIQQLPHK